MRAPGFQHLKNLKCEELVFKVLLFHVQLVPLHLGFPIVIVSKWEDLTQQMLEDYYASPKYKTIDWEHVLQMLRVDHWSQRFLC